MSVEVPDFDVLVALHQYDPQAFEQLRECLLRQAVDSAPPEHRPSLEQLLCRIEAAHAAADGPAEAALVAFRMMSESVSRLHDAWTQALQSMAGMQAALLIERISRGTAREDTQWR